MISIAKCIPIRQNRIPYKITVLPCPYLVSCAKNHDIERRRAVVKLPRAREKEREEDTVCSVVHIIFSRDVISEIHTRDTQVSYVTYYSMMQLKSSKHPSSQFLPPFLQATPLQIATTTNSSSTPSQSAPSLAPTCGRARPWRWSAGSGGRPRPGPSQCGTGRSWIRRGGERIRQILKIN